MNRSISGRILDWLFRVTGTPRNNEERIAKEKKRNER